MTEAISLEALGLSQESLADRLVDKLADGLLSSLEYDEDGYTFRGESPFANKLNKMVRERLNEIVEDLGNKHVLPVVSEMVEGLVLQETNKWGEKVGNPVTFKEYLVQRADVYMTEKVNYEGKTKDQAGGYSFNGKQTRVSHMIDKHLHYEIERAMKEAMALATGSIARGLHETVRTKINEVCAGLKVEVKTK